MTHRKVAISHNAPGGCHISTHMFWINETIRALISAETRQPSKLKEGSYGVSTMTTTTTTTTIITTTTAG